MNETQWDIFGATVGTTLAVLGVIGDNVFAVAFGTIGVMVAGIRLIKSHVPKL